MEDFQKLFDRGLRFLAIRARSVWEMEKFLEEKRRKLKIADSSLVAKVIERLKELGYVDERKFVDFWVNARQGRKPKGVKVIAWELKAHGVSEELIEEVLKGRSDSGSQKDLAIKAGERKLKIWEKYPLVIKKKKLYEHLLRQGFDTQAIWQAIDELTKKS